MLPDAIRNANPTDVPAILGFVRELAALEGRPEAATATAAQINDLLFGPSPRGCALIMCDDDAVVGYAWYFFATATFVGKPILALEDIYITPAARGKGFGRQAFTHLAKLALQHGCAAIDWSVVENNSAAIEYYQRLGAKQKTGSYSYRLDGPALDRVAGG